jgi:large subunit ribosomal protein L24
MGSSPHSPRRQRRALYNSDSFERRRRMAVPLSRELRSRFHLRSLPLRKGDTVRVLSGSFVGREERVAKVDRRALSVTLDNVTLKAADEKLKPLALRPSHLVLTRLNLSDPWRRRRLRVRDEDVTPEERGEAPEEGSGEAPPPSETPAPPAPEAPAESEEPADEGTEAKPRPKRKAKPATAEESDA